MNFQNKEIEKQYFELFDLLKKISKISDYNEIKNKIILDSATSFYQEINKKEIKNLSITKNTPFLEKNMCRLVGRFFDSKPLSPIGSRGRNSRYHYYKDEPDSIYFTQNETTALKECNRGLLTPSPPGTLYWFQINLANMLDLSTPKSCQSNGVNYDFLMNKELEWRMVNTIFGTKSYSQYIGESAYEKGFEGILYESSKESESKNLIIFPKNMQQNSQVLLLDCGNKDSIAHILSEDRAIQGYI